VPGWPDAYAERDTADIADPAAQPIAVTDVRTWRRKYDDVQWDGAWPDH
jgi:hypothetical protein